MGSLASRCRTIVAYGPTRKGMNITNANSTRLENRVLLLIGDASPKNSAGCS